MHVHVRYVIILVARPPSVVTVLLRILRQLPFSLSKQSRIVDPNLLPQLYRLPRRLHAGLPKRTQADTLVGKRKNRTLQIHLFRACVFREPHYAFVKGLSYAGTLSCSGRPSVDTQSNIRRCKGQLQLRHFSVSAASTCSTLLDRPLPAGSQVHPTGRHSSLATGSSCLSL